MRRCVLWLGLILGTTGCTMLGGEKCATPVVCPRCHEHCTLEIEKVSESNTCYEVECEAICVPRVKLPWKDGCEPPQCARTRLVHVLVEKEYECERCHYKWTPVCCENCKPEDQDKDE